MPEETTAVSEAEKRVNITVELSDEEAYQFAQFLKRVGYHEYRALSTSDSEVSSMINAGEIIRKALAEAGYAPR